MAMVHMSDGPYER